MESESIELSQRLSMYLASRYLNKASLGNYVNIVKGTNCRW